MINFFPILYEDELLYSVISRYKQMCGMISKRALERDLYNQREGQKSVLFPIHLNTLISNLPLGSKITVDEIIWNHTMFPFYTTFFSEERVEKVYKAMQEDYNGSIENMVGISGSKVKSGDFLKYCPLCFQTDMDVLGISYWRRLHQVPGVLYCPLHEVLLKMSNVNITDSRVDYQCADEDTCNVDIVEDKNTQLIKDLNMKYIENVSFIMSGKFQLKGPSFLFQFYIDKLRGKHLASKSGTLYMKNVEEEFFAFYPDEYLELMQSKVNLNQEANWLRLFVRSTRKNRSPVRHLLFLQFLGVSVNELFETERVIGKKTIKANRKPLFEKEEKRKEWLRLIEDHPKATRSELKRLAKGLHTWIYVNDWDWYDKVTPRINTRKKRTDPIDWERRDEETLELARRGYEILLNMERKPIRIVPSNIRRVVGVKRWFNHKNLVKTRKFLNEIYEDIDSYRNRKIKWAIEDRIKKGEPLTVYKVQLHAGFGGGNKTIKQLIENILKNYT